MRILIAAILLSCLSLPAKADSNAYTVLASSLSAIATSGRISPQGGKIAFQLMGTTSVGAGQVTVLIKGSNDGVSYVQVSSLTLDTIIAQTSTGESVDKAWRYYISSATHLTGSGARYSVFANSKQ